jgi:hypothetical protein
MFDDLYLVATKYTPDISLQCNGRISFVGRSYPENAYEFYQPILDWINHYFNNEDSPRTVWVDFEVSYFNSSSSKIFFDILSILDHHHDGFTIKIRWTYDVDNDNAQEAGEEFMDDFPDLSIEMIVSPNA